MSDALALPLPYDDPVRYAALVSGDAFALFLDSAADTGGRGRYSYVCADPSAVLTDPGADPFAAAASLLGPRRTALPDLPPFQGGVAGFFGYELNRFIERVPAPPGGLPLPDLAVARFDAVAAFDHARQQAWVIGTSTAALALHARLSAAPPLPPLDWSKTAGWTADLTAEDYRAKLDRVLDYIRAGDAYQVNLAQRFTSTLPDGLPPFMLYRRLRQTAAAPFGGFLRCGDTALLSASPERFLRLSADGRVETRPIKGTRRRAADAGQDAALAAELLASPKDRAENLMIVDLLRNDLSKVCAVGSVKVPELFALETFPAVHHLVSAVEGRLAEGHGPFDLLRACFPGGSITGAPKVRAMEIIAELEPVRRGAYCGAIGWIGFDHAMDSNIAIRTIQLAGRTIALHAGGGIVADSDPWSEYDETLVKAAALKRSLEG